MTDAVHQDRRTSPPHVLMVFDDRYAEYAAVALRSIQLNGDAGGSGAAVAHLCSIGVRPRTRDAVEASAPGLAYRWYELDGADLDALPAGSAGTSSTAYGLLFALDTVDAERAIALDVDLLVRRDLGPLWSTDLGDAAVGAVRDPVIGWIGHPTLGIPRAREQGLDARRPNLNSGVLVVDLDGWRRRELTPRCLQYLVSNREGVRFNDQDAFNARVEHWVELPPQWNVIADPGREVMAPMAIGYDAYDRAVDDPAIVHYAGSAKPWNWLHPRRDSLRYVDEWMSIASKTAFAESLAADRRAAERRGRSAMTKLTRATARCRKAWKTLVGGAS